VRRINRGSRRFSVEVVVMGVKSRRQAEGGAVTAADDEGIR